MDKLNALHEKYGDIIAIVLIFTFALVSPFFGGFDYTVAYRGDTLAKTYGHLTYGPYPIYWFIYPFAILPVKAGYILWNLANAVCFILAIRYWKGNLLAFSFFIGTFWIFYGGQIEGFMAGALVLITLPNPWLAGLGITILSLKPQIGLLPIIFSLINKKDWKLLVIPTIVYVASFVKWGWWVSDWLSTLQTIKTTATIMVTIISLYPYGLILLPLLWRYKTSLKIWMYVQSLATPYYPIYSLTPLFTISTPPIWVGVATWIFYLLLSSHLVLSKFGFIFPLGLLIYELWKTERIYKKTASNASQETSPTFE